MTLPHRMIGATRGIDPDLAFRRPSAMSRTTRDLYLDLLIKILTNMIYGDPSTNPTNRGPYQAELRREGLDWPAVAHTMIGVSRLENVRGLAQRVIDENIPGDFIETGVWRGGCCILMRGVLEANAVTDRKVYVADSFAGLPPPNLDLYPQDTGLDLSIYPELAVPLEEVKENFRRYGLLDDQVVFVPGLFQDTLPSLQADQFALIRLDGDLYESTYVALEALYPKLSQRGFVIIDDFKLFPQCKQAVIDYRARMGIAAVIHDIDRDGVWWQNDRSK
jgi:O-methyltransferase/8-demethyl-8-(2,3-dimethoxy-alpha-L-rhamnosyl)tetracenomycin-C 4'-O-methyltransferase